MNIGWPEGLMLGLLAFGLIVTALLDGEPKTGTYKLSIRILDTGIILGLLWWGGFFA